MSAYRFIYSSLDTLINFNRVFLGPRYCHIINISNGVERFWYVAKNMQLIFITIHLEIIWFWKWTIVNVPTLYTAININSTIVTSTRKDTRPEIRIHDSRNRVFIMQTIINSIITPRRSRNESNNIHKTIIDRWLYIRHTSAEQFLYQNLIKKQVLPSSWTTTSVVSSNTTDILYVRSSFWFMADHGRCLRPSRRQYNRADDVGLCWQGLKTLNHSEKHHTTLCQIRREGSHCRILSVEIRKDSHDIDRVLCKSEKCIECCVNALLIILEIGFDDTSWSFMTWLTSFIRA